MIILVFALAVVVFFIRLNPLNGAKTFKFETGRMGMVERDFSANER